MGKMEASIEINAPPEKVWEMLAFDKQSEWVDELENVKFTSEVNTPKDKYKVGATAQSTMEGEGEFITEITESLENEKMTFRSKGGRTSATTTFLLESIEGGTRLTNAMDYTLPWGILGKGLDKLFARRLGKKHMEKNLQKLKSILER